MIEINNLSKVYYKDTLSIEVLKNLSLTVNKNESVAILGDSGSGKTTLLSLMAGLEAPTTGEIKINGVAIEKLNQGELTKFRLHNLGIIFQLYHLMDYLSALENVMLPLEINGQKDCEKKAMFLLGEVGLAERANHLPSQLSGGECQRVALARSLVAAPQILLADEPTGSLDNKTGESVMDLLFKLKNQHQITLVLVTHNEALAERCDRILRMQDGRLI